MDGWVTIGTKLDTKDFDRQIESVEEKLEGLEEEYNILKNAKPFEGQDKQLRKLNKEIITTKKELASLQKQRASLTDVSSISAANSAMSGVLKKVTKWGLAIFGIRSAYSFIRSSMSTLSQYNQQMATDLEYVRYALASSIKPLIEGIIKLVQQLLTYINYIAQAWFGINLFASAKEFENMKKSSAGVAKNAKEINKQLAGFDEMNILSDTSSSSSGGGGSVDIPSFDLTNFDIPIPSWIKWIADNKDIVIAGLAGIAAGLLAVKAGATAIQGLGIGIALIGIIYSIEKIIDFLNDPTFENFIGILEGITIAVLGVAIAIGAWPVAVGAAVAFIVVEIVKNFDKIMGLFDNLINWLDINVLGALRGLFGPVGDILYIPIKQFVELARGAFQGFYGGIKDVIDGVVKIFNGDFLGGIKSIFGGLLSIMTAPLQGFLKSVQSIIPLITNAFKQIGTKAGEVIGGAFKAVINGVLGAIESILNTPIKAVNSLITTINKIPGINLGKLSTFSLPRLAKGGIISMPGRGVPVGGAIGGEAGREGVIPLTDAQQMALLGEAIGKYININLTNITKLDNRQIAREQKVINAQSDFAYNR